MTFNITTKLGDDGFTQVSIDKRASKGSKEVELMGSVDELQVAIGSVLVYDADIKQMLIQIQKDVFDVASLVFNKKNEEKLIESVITLEGWQETLLKRHTIDYDWHLTTPETRHIDEARVRTRRCERNIVALMQDMQDAEYLRPAQKYLNRLSDFLWVVGRIIKQRPYHRKKNKLVEEDKKLGGF